MMIRYAVHNHTVKEKVSYLVYMCGSKSEKSSDRLGVEPRKTGRSYHTRFAGLDLTLVL